MVIVKIQRISLYVFVKLHSFQQPSHMVEGWQDRCCLKVVCTTWFDKCSKESDAQCTRVSHKGKWHALTVYSTVKQYWWQCSGHARCYPAHQEKPVVQSPTQRHFNMQINGRPSLPISDMCHHDPTVCRFSVQLNCRFYWFVPLL